MLPVTRNNAIPFPAAAGPVNRLDTLFDRLLADDGGASSRAWARPPMAMWQDDDHLFIEVEMPGVAEQDVEMTIHNGVLTIRGERKPEEGRQYLFNARAYGRFEQVITLPEAVDTAAVEARLTDGVLFIDLPKRPEAKPRKITIRGR